MEYEKTLTTPSQSEIVTVKKSDIGGHSRIRRIYPYETCWEALKKYIKEYEKKHVHTTIEVLDDSCDMEVYGRYCVAISCEDLLKKMDEIEKGEKNEKRDNI